MIESELAFDKDGERFVVSDKATDWRLSRLRGGRGAPEIVYGRDGGPATHPIDGTMEDLRALVSEVVGESCRLRLDAIDADGKAVPDVPRAYVQVTIGPRNASMPVEPPVPPNLSSTDHAIRELVRANCELVRANSDLAKTVATQQSAVVLAAAELLRAADGAGLSRREPIAYLDDERDEGEDEALTPAQPGSDWVSVAHEALATAKMVAAAVMATRQGAPTTESAATSGSVAPDAPQRTSPSANTAPEAAPPPNPVSVNPHAHLLAIQAQLTPAESAFVMDVISKLPPEACAQWTEQLTEMSVADAVARIRTEIEKRREKAS